MNENELDNLVDMAHTIFLRMVVRGGFDSYTGARLHEWLRRYEKLPLRESMLKKFMELARDHYWDSLEPQKELIIKHFESLVSMAASESAQHTLAGGRARVCPECDSEIAVCIMGHYCGEKTPAAKA